MTLSARRLLAWGWTVLIVAACSIPGTDLPEVDIELADKAAHFAMFFGYGWLWLNAMRGGLRKRLVIVLLAGSLFAALTEVYQGLLPFSRTPDPIDALANLAGLVVSALVHAMLPRFRGRLNSDTI